MNIDHDRLAELKKKRGYKFSELEELCQLESAVLKAAVDDGTKTWGNWRYGPTDPPSIDYHPYRYEIVLTRIDTVSRLGDWLLHMSEKGWITTEDLGNLVKAVQDLEYIGYHRISGRGCA